MKNKIIIIIIILVSLTGCSRDTVAELTVNANLKEPVNLGEVLTPKVMKEDFDILVKTLKNVHPATIDEFTDRQKEIIDEIYLEIKKPMNARKFHSLINQLIVSFKDVHTNAVLNVASDYANIPIEWLHDGIYISQDTDLLKAGDKVVLIGDKNEEELLKGLQKVSSYENDFYLKRVSKYLLYREYYLEELNVIDEDKTVSLTIKRKGSLKELKVPITDELTIEFDTGDRDWIGYYFEEDYSLGVFYFNKCLYNDEFKEKIEEFFTKASEKNIQNIAIDLRKNMGGVTQYLKPLLSYLDFDKYYSQSMNLRYSKEVQKLLNYEKASGYEKGKRNLRTNKKIEDENLLFKGNVYVLTSSLTMSSANTLAIIIKDNNIGTIIGEPTGQKTHRYGDAPFFYLPNTGFRIQVSHKEAIRPDITAGIEDATYPDITVYTKIDDILNGTDSQIEKLKEVINNKGK